MFVSVSQINPEQSFSVLTPFSRTNICYCFQHIPTSPVLPSNPQFLKKRWWLKWKTPHDSHSSPVVDVGCIYLFPLLALQLWQSWFHHNAVYPPETEKRGRLQLFHNFTPSILWSNNTSPPSRSTPTRPGLPAPRLEPPKRRRSGVLPSSSFLMWTLRLCNNIAVLQLLLQTTAMNHLHCQIDIKHTEAALGSSTNNWCCCFSKEDRRLYNNANALQFIQT